MSSPTPESPLEFTFTADELRAAMRLVNPGWNPPAGWYDEVAAARSDRPMLLPPRVGVALTVVSERLRRIADATWTEPEMRDAYLRDRPILERIARGEAPPPGW
jgi:hypothetical protein